MSALLELTGASVLLGGRVVVGDVSLTIARGEVVALLGANGAGKTTLLRAALGLAPVGFGTVNLMGADPMLLSARDRGLRAAYLPQRPQAIWPVHVEQLVSLGRYAHGAAPDRLGARDQAAVDDALEACALTPLRKRRMDEISGGEKARAHLARALAQKAPLLLLDEPTAGLDPAQALGVAEIMRARANDGAILFSTHDVALAARVAQRVLLLEQGHVIAEGPPLQALTPEALSTAYGRPGRLEQVGQNIVAVFE
ncbi:MAG TPA: ABC transporter ATP-binding protein [Candidatus Binatia bacterium]|nr:ABC transporter ATP-binding protein [Candidatus Binatia bacterium]